jgi:hypothetical protein
MMMQSMMMMKWHANGGSGRIIMVMIMMKSSRIQNDVLEQRGSAGGMNEMLQCCIWIWDHGSWCSSSSYYLLLHYC